MTDLGLAHKNGRCAHGFAPQQRQFHDCADLTPIAPTAGSITPAEWRVFVEAVKAVARPDREVHPSDIRPLIRGRIKPNAIGPCYTRATSMHLLEDTKRREQSDDLIGRNTNKQDRIFVLGRAA